MSSVTSPSRARAMLSTSLAGETVWDHLPVEVQRELIAKDIALYVIDADGVARDTGMGNRVNTVMQPCFFSLSGVLPADEAIGHIKASVEKSYGNRGRSIVERNFAAIDASVAALARVEIPSAVTSTTTRHDPSRPNARSSSGESPRCCCRRGDLLLLRDARRRGFPPERRSTRSARSPPRSRSSTPTCASTAAVVRPCARTPRSA